MMNKKSIFVGVLLSMAGAQAYSTIQEIHADPSMLSLANESGESKIGRYIVQLKSPSTIGLNQGNSKLREKSGRLSLLESYKDSIVAEQDMIMAEVGLSSASYNFVHSFNGFSAKLSKSQLQLLKKNPKVLRIWDDALVQPHTDSTVGFLGLSSSSGQHTLGIKGEDVIVGVLDTGISPENPSFIDDGSYSAPASINWNGSCDKGSEAELETFSCNNKLIGARFFNETFKSQYEIQTGLGEFLSPRDVSGHGSHTASTAAGNEAVAAELLGVDIGKAISGMAPRARISAYKICWNSEYVNPETRRREAGCFYSDSMAAIDQAILDGVDVLNYSIGGSGQDLVTPVAMAMLRASDAGIFVAASAGNSGFLPGSVSNTAPWVMTVAASTKAGTRARVSTEVDILEYKSEVGFKIDKAVPALFTPSIKGKVSMTARLASPLNGCGNKGLEKKRKMKGKLALIERGGCSFSEKVLNAQQAGAEAVVIYNNKRGDAHMMDGSAKDISIPALMITQSEGLKFTAAINRKQSKIAINGEMVSKVELDANRMADFSSRGPNPSTMNVIKPDITAPGVAILAATSDTPMFGKQGETQRYLQGTSMSSPHIAGLAALLIEQYSDWSPAQVKSAMMTTARQDIARYTLEDILAGPFDFGSGHAVPVDAADPGLTYDINAKGYMKFLCGLGYGNRVDFAKFNCSKALSKNNRSVDARNLNYPSIAVYNLGDESQTIYREVTNVAGVSSHYLPQIEAPAGIDVKVDVEKTDGIVMAVKDKKIGRYSLTFTKNDNVVLNKWTYGNITWVDEHGHRVRSPIAVMPKATIEETISTVLKNGVATFKVKPRFKGSVSLDTRGLHLPSTLNVRVPRDPDNTYSFNDLIDKTSGVYIFGVASPSTALRVKLDPLVNNEMITSKMDLDLYLYACFGGTCYERGASTRAGSNEVITLLDPSQLNNPGHNEFYMLAVHGKKLDKKDEIRAKISVWRTSDNNPNTTFIAPDKLKNGKSVKIQVGHKGARSGDVLVGTLDYIDDNNVSQGRTILEVKVKVK